MSDKNDQDDSQAVFEAVPVEEDPFFAPPEVLAEVPPPPPPAAPPPPPGPEEASESPVEGGSAASPAKPSVAEVLAERRRREEERRQREAEEAEARRVLEESCPWENAGEMGFLASWWQSVAALFTSPVQFFANIPEKAGIGRALLFGLVTAWFAHVLSLPRRFLEFQNAEPVRAWLGDYLRQMKLDQLADGLMQQGGNFWLGEAIGLAGYPVGWLTAVFLMSLMTHIPVKLMGGQGGLGATFRALAYSTPMAFLGMLPWAGGLLMLAGHMVLIPTGLQIQHRLSTPRLMLALLFWPLFGLFSAALMVLVFWSALSGLMSQ